MVWGKEEGVCAGLGGQWGRGWVPGEAEADEGDKPDRELLV